MVSWLLREKGLGCVEELDKQTKKVNKEIRCNTSRNRVESETDKLREWRQVVWEMVTHGVSISHAGWLRGVGG